MTVWFVRHGETAKNREKRLQGRSNAPLNESGTKQAADVKRFFEESGVSFDAVYSSPLLRAVQTAEIITAKKEDINLDESLLEMDYGPYEGCSLESPPPEIIEFFRDFVHNPAPHGVESLDHVTARLGDFLERIKYSEAENILIATHAIAMKGALEYLTPESKGSYWSKYIGTCAVYKAEYDGAHYSIPEEVFSLNYEPGV